MSRAAKKREMDETEAQVAKLLVHLGHKSVVFEPDGNVPPDFLVDERVAVEARRLNQHFSHAGTVQGLESIRIAMRKNVERLTQTLGPPPTGETSWYYSVDFQRPIEPWRTLMPKIERTFRSFMSQPNRKATTLYAANNVKIDLIRSDSVSETFFVMAGQNDFDSGGWLLAELEQNLRHCVAEKTMKSAPYRSRYPGWWLIFVDQITYGLDKADLQMFREQTPIEHDWQRIILVDPHDYTRWFEL